MSKSVMKWLVLFIAIGLCIQLNLYSPVQSATEEPARVKELNLVFLHGAGGNACDMQLLADSIVKQVPAYILDYEQVNPETKIRINMLQRCYPNDVDIDAWANNIADSIDKHFADKENLILIGHSMGGKAAIYGVAQRIGGLTGKVSLVVTINSPIKSLYRYRVAGGGPVVDYCRAGWLLSDKGVCRSLAYYDSSDDGNWVGRYKHWLAFISAEASPMSEQFDVGGVDGWPRNMDDGLVPITAQYSDEADVVYYGEYGHSDFKVMDEVAEVMADRILRYIFGGRLECSVLESKDTLEHEAAWFPGIDRWEDVVGEVPASSGRLHYRNESYISWQEWEEIVGTCPGESVRGNYQISLVRTFPFLAGIQESRWLIDGGFEDCRLYLRTRVAPRNSVDVYWYIYHGRLLPEGIERDHYEVEIVTGTPFTEIKQVSWVTDNLRDLRLEIRSEAESPFRWFQAEWRVYSKESRYRKVIDEIQGQMLLNTSPRG